MEKIDPHPPKESILDQIQNKITKIEKKLGNEIASAVYMVIVISTFFAMLIFTRITKDRVDVIKSQAIRGWGYLIVSHYIMKKQKIPTLLTEPKQERLRLLRNGIGMAFNVVFFFIATKIPISEIYILVQFSPFFIGFLDSVYYKTKYELREGLLAVMGFLGVILVIKPDLLFLPESNVYSGSTKGLYAEGEERFYWRLFFLGSILIWSFSILMVKGIKIPNAMTLNYPFGYFMAISSSVLMIQMGIEGDMKIQDFIFTFMCHGFLSVINQNCLVRALQLGRPGKVQMFQNMNVVNGFLFEVIYEHLYPQWYSILGAILVISSTILISLYKLKKQEGEKK